MKIKRLSIHGFKSFVDKVNLNFSSGASGIIGPNGCGKSNIVDAIRWVIGEQNARHLRGKHMEDVIFNGSETRKPMGMAEVTLTFANDNGSAPARFADMPEIEISRRLYRSGESEYYLNKVQCRLRDIVEAFTDTGIGGRAYSIVEQGQVAWLINAKPEERRVVFEEAAGINRFKHKKEAALRRLEATRENLTRVNDIISEVKRQLNSLNRQAKKAERYKALRDEFKAVDLKLATVEFSKTALVLQETSKKLEGLKDSEAGLNAGIAANESSLEEIKYEAVQTEILHNEAREKAHNLEKRLQAEESLSALALARADELGRNEVRLTSEVEELKKDKQTLLTDAEALRASIAEHEGDCKALSEKAGALSNEHGLFVSGLKEKEAELGAQTAGAVRVNAKLSDIKHAIGSCLKDEEYSRARHAKAAVELDAAIKAIESKHIPIATLAQAVASRAGKKEEAEATLGGLKARLESIEKNKSAGEAELKGLKDECARAGARLLTLEEMEKGFENIEGGARSVMLKGDLAGVRGLIADVIETNPGYEKAVEAVLGERLQYVIVESHIEGVKAIEYLKASSSGRGSFVPVRDLRPVNAPVPATAVRYNAPGVKELLSEVRIKDGYDAVVNYLLGDTLVTEDLDSALSVWREDGICGKTVVTVGGEVIDAQGIITGGAGRGDGAGILQRRGEIKKLRLSLSASEALAQERSAAIKNMTEEIASTAAELEKVKEGFHSSEIEKVNLEAELKRQEEELKRLEQAKEALSAEIIEASAKLEETAAKKAGYSAERESAEKELVIREAEVASLKKEISSLTEKKDALSADLTAAKVSLAQSIERLEALKNQLGAREKAALDVDKKAQAKGLEIEAGRREASEKLIEADGFKTKIEALLKDLDAAKKDEVAIGERLSAHSGKIKEAEAEIKALKDKLSDLFELKGELSIEVKETEISLNNQVEKIIEKYGVDLRSAPAPEAAQAEEIEWMEASKEDLRQKIAALGEVSLSALEEYNDLDRRHQFLLEQQADLSKSVDALHNAITRINRTTRERFQSAFDEINEKFKENFPRFFSGGRAELRLTEGDDVLEAGVEIVAQPPGKRLQSIALLSGGEKALTATSLIFSIFLIKPSPFCLLDEVDAPLDDANINRFNGFVKEMSEMTQFLLITHNKRTMEMADTLYGITMEEPGVSKIISVKF